MSQHPVTTEYGEGDAQITATLEATRELGLPAIVLWPNADAGSEDVSRGIRRWRERGLGTNMHFFKNLPTALSERVNVHVAELDGADEVTITSLQEATTA